MRRLCLVGALCLAGCQGLVGPIQHRDNPQRADNPYLSIDEQKRKGRDLLALPEDSPRIAPPTYFDPPGTRGSERPG